MKSLRFPSAGETTVIKTLLESSPESRTLLTSLDHLLVSPMPDSGMGSLLLVPPCLPQVKRVFGRQIALGEFEDGDGVLVSACINLDQQGQLYELDVWKSDFSPLVAWPDSAAIRIVH